MLILSSKVISTVVYILCRSKVRAICGCLFVAVRHALTFPKIYCFVFISSIHEHPPPACRSCCPTQKHPVRNYFWKIWHSPMTAREAVENHPYIVLKVLNLSLLQSFRIFHKYMKHFVRLAYGCHHYLNTMYSFVVYIVSFISPSEIQPFLRINSEIPKDNTPGNTK